MCKYNSFNSAISLAKNHFLFENYLEYLNTHRDSRKNSLWKIAQIVSLFQGKHQKLVPKFRSRERDFDEKKRGVNEKEGRQ